MSGFTYKIPDWFRKRIDAKVKTLAVALEGDEPHLSEKERLRREIKKLRAALEPFARESERHEQGYYWSYDEIASNRTCTYGDFDRARKAYIEIAP